MGGLAAQVYHPADPEELLLEFWAPSWSYRGFYRSLTPFLNHDGVGGFGFLAYVTKDLAQGADDKPFTCRARTVNICACR